MIRQHMPKDLSEVLDIWLKTNIDAHAFIPKEYWLAHYPAVKEQLPQANLLIFAQEDTIQGFVGTLEDYIAGIFVAKEYRSQGIGKKLLDTLKQTHSTLTLQVYQKNQKAVAFYKREGFSITAETIEEETKEKDYTMTWKKP